MAGRYCLHGRKGTGSAAPEAAFAEAGVAIDLVEVPSDAGAAEQSGFLAVNPRGQVPALILPDGTAIAEGTAILLHIADAFPAAGLAPRPGSFARAHHDRWLLFLQANIYEGELRHYYPDRYTAGPACTDTVRIAAEDYVKRHYRLFEASLADTPFACGERLSTLDIYLWTLAQWVEQDWLALHCPKIALLSGRVASRPLIAPIHHLHFG